MSDQDEYAGQTALIKRHFEPVLTEPIPARMHLRTPPWMGYARAAGLLVVGIAVGLAIPHLRQEPQPLVSVMDPGLAVRAAHAHKVYVSEVRHPVEVDASQQEHLVAWLSKRLGTSLRVPVLAQDGFELLGGRLLPGAEGKPVAQLMYQDSSGKRLTLYVSRRDKDEALTAFRFAQEGPVSVFYWVDRDCGYALSGEIDRPRLAKVAGTVYQQLEPR